MSDADIHNHMPSFPPSSSSAQSSAKSLLRLSTHSRKQLKFLLPGAAVTYFLGTVARFSHLVQDEASSSWARLTARTSLVCGLATILLFLYILLAPWIKGSPPDYKRWRQHSDLSFVVPLLTALMVIGWPLLSFTLTRWTDLGLLKGTIASSALYALVFGVLGLLPAPMHKRH